MNSIQTYKWILFSLTLILSDAQFYHKSSDSPKYVVAGEGKQIKGGGASLKGSEPPTQTKNRTIQIGFKIMQWLSYVIMHL